MEYSIYEDPDSSKMATYSVSIFGDLRNYEDLDYIEKWFNQVVLDKTIIIRGAVLTAEVECGGKICLVYNDDYGDTPYVKRIDV